MIKTTFFSLFLMLTGTICRSQDANNWTSSISSEGAKDVTCIVFITTPSGLREGRFSIVKGRGAGGVLSISLSINNVMGITGFNFDDFEGPDSKSKEKLMNIAITGTSKDQAFSFKPEGSYITIKGEDGDGFEFGKYWKGKDSPLKQLVRLCAGGHGKLFITIFDPRNKNMKLSVEIDITGNDSKFKTLLD